MKNEQWRRWRAWWDKAKVELQIDATHVNSPPLSAEKLLPQNDNVVWGPGETETEDEMGAWKADEMEKPANVAIKTTTKQTSILEGGFVSGITL